MPKSKPPPGIREHHGRFQARYRDPAGIQRAKSFARLTDARAFLDATKTDVRRGSWVDPQRGRETLEAFWERWLRHAEELGRPAERTRIAYEELWRLYVGPVLGRRSLASITRADVSELVAAVGERSVWRAQDVLKLVRMLLNRAVDEEMILRNPAARVSAPRVEQQEPWVLTPAEVERLVDAVPERWRVFVLLGAYSSLRWSELIAIRVDRVDILRRRIRVEEKITEHGRLIPGEPKTRQSRRSVAIPQSVAEALAAHIRTFPPSPDGLVLTGRGGGPVRRPAFGRLVWRPATVRAGLSGFPFKNLRHTGASLAIAAGANPMLVAARLGHSSTRMVERHYVSLFEGLDREIGERLETMREQREPESARLRSGSDVNQMWTRRRPRTKRAVPLRAAQWP